MHGTTRISKATPLDWLAKFLAEYNPGPSCKDKYVVLDQGGELYGNPTARSLFEEAGYTIRATGAESSNQNVPVERAHQTIGKALRAMLSGAGLSPKFCPYAFHISSCKTPSQLLVCPPRSRNLLPVVVTISPASVLLAVVSGYASWRQTLPPRPECSIRDLSWFPTRHYAKCTMV